MTEGRTPHDAPASDLERLARHEGVLPSYSLMGGRERREASPDALLAVLRALDVPVHGPGDAGEVLRASRLERWSRLAEPVAVVWTDTQRAGVPLRLVGGETAADLDCTLFLEGGEERSWTARASDLADRLTQELEGRVFVGGRLPLPPDLPVGYHDLRVRAGAREGRTRLLAAPSTVWEPGAEEGGRGGRRRDFGLFLPLYALRTARSWGTADLGDLASLLAWAGERGARFLGTLPLTAAFLDERGVFDPSPYAPMSRLFWNELYLDVERAPGLERAPAARELLGSAAFREEARALRDAPRVRYREAMALKRRVLEELARSLAPADRPLPAELRAWTEAKPEALDYARFRALGERLGRPWREWPAAERAGSPGEADLDDETVRYHLYAQWTLDGQVRELARGELSAGAAGAPSLYLDLPLGAHPDGYDVWRHRDVFALGLSGGAPPDALCAAGQDWGFPPPHPRRAREQGHAYTAACLRHLMGAAGMLRLDHVMSLHRLFCIPSGLPASEGVYVRYPEEELYALLCIESRRARCEVVGEDLGTVPDEVRASMRRRRLRGMYVLPFELEVKEAPAPRSESRARLAPPMAELRPVPPLTVASLGTHDLPPFAAFWSGEDLEDGPEREEERRGRARWREALAAVLHQEAATGAGTGALEAELGGALRGALGLLAASPAEHLLVSVEDLWLETEPQNRPGTAGEENWTHKARHPLEAWSGLPGVEDTLATVREARGRPPGRPDAPGRKERAR